MSIHSYPVIVSWDDETNCYIVSDFQRDFKPILTDQNLCTFIKEYARLGSPDKVRWHPYKGGANFSESARTPALREEELKLQREWLAKHEVERPGAKAPIPDFSLDELLGETPSE